MQTVAACLRKRRWVAFLIHQLFIFGIAVVFLSSVRRFTGRSIHLGRDPVGVIDGTALALLSIAVIFVTNWYYRFVTVTGAPSLGIELSRSRVVQMIAGFCLGAVFFAAPWLISLWNGTAAVTDRIGNHFDAATAAVVLLATIVLLLLQATTEETANRAFPMQLWEDRALFFRLLVPTAFFVLIHLVNEPFEVQRVAVLMIGGLIHGMAYALTGNIWLSTGLHFGANVGSYSMSGLWHAGAIVHVSGQPFLPIWSTSLTLLVILVLAFIIKRNSETRDAKVQSANA